MTTREILTLQFGHYSNYIGTHWWNLQEFAFDYTSQEATEVNNNVLYREGQTHKGDTTYTPRLLLVDLKGSLHALPQHGGLYETSTPEEPVVWHDNLVETKKQPPVQKNKYQQDLDNVSTPSSLSDDYNLEDSVRVWSDYLYTRFHPRTVNVVKEYEHDKGTGFDVFPMGTSLWKTEYFEDDFCDKMRNYIEECDSFQGFQILTDATNAFSGLTLGCIEYIRDEYERKSVLTFPVLPSYYSDYSYTNDDEQNSSQIKDSIRLLNLALCYERLAEHSSLCVPMCTAKNGWRQPGPKREFYHVNYNEKLPYHTSAILASALDTFSLKYRLKSTTFSVSDLCTDLNNYGRKIAAASICLPFSFNRGADLIDCLDKWEGPLSQSITPNCSIGTDRCMQLITLRGVGEDRLKRPTEQAGCQKDMPAYKCNSVNEMLSFYLSCTCFGSATNVTTVKKGLSVSVTYPRIFDSFVGVDGNITSESRPDYLYPKTVPTLAGLHSGKEIGDMLELLHTDTRRIKFPRFHQFTSAGLENDEFTESLDKLFTLRECYEDKYLI